MSSGQIPLLTGIYTSPVMAIFVAPIQTGILLPNRPTEQAVGKTPYDLPIPSGREYAWLGISSEQVLNVELRPSDQALLPNLEEYRRFYSENYHKFYPPL